MFTLILAGLVVVTGVAFWLQHNKHKSDLHYEDSWIIFSTLLFIAAAALIAIRGFGSYAMQISDFASVRQTQSAINLFVERRDNLTVIIRTELAKYPEYEKKIMGNITPQILLQFPTLKSNETIIKTVEEIVKIENDVYKLREELIRTQAQIYYREITPWKLYVTPYEKFFGEKNPVSGNK